MKSLLIVAHGSRREESNNEIRALTQKVASLEHNFHEVTCAFLELAEPSIPDGIRHAIKNGATEVTVMPYFLSAGRHVAKDVPADIETVQKEYPDIRITLSAYLGSADTIPELIINQANQ